MSRCYDYLIVGAGLFGATFARIVTDFGARCLVIDRRTHVGGNCYSERRDGLDVHMYGPHVFHTNNEAVWAFVQRFSRFRPYYLRVLANYDDKLYSLPFSLQTLSEFYGSGSPSELLERLEADRLTIANPRSLREQALSQVGVRLYEVLIKGYSEKQWGRDGDHLPASIMRRLPIRQNYSVAYHDDRYQGLPEDGYATLVARMLDGIDVHLAVNFLSSKDRLVALARRVVYTGPLDSLFDFCHGHLEWRYTEFAHSRLSCANFQGTAVINYTSRDVPWTRITEHRHFDARWRGLHTWITKEFSRSEGGEPSYPIEDERNRLLQLLYLRRAKEEGYIVGGRLGEYRYYDMHQVIASAMRKAERAMR